MVCTFTNTDVPFEMYLIIVVVVYIFIILSSVIHLSMDPLLLHDVCYLK